jgi:diaminopropionate ammonia-lyase
VVYIHGHVSEGRKEAIERYGAIVIRIDGEYEQSVARAREDCRINGWHFVSSTSWDDFNEPIPRYVMHAYMVMVEEALAQLPSDRPVTHVFMQGGVGSIPAAIFLGFAQQGSGRSRGLSSSNRSKQAACTRPPSTASRRPLPAR